MESLELKNFLRDVGESVHSMNTIAVALSLLPNKTKTPPKGLEISWKPKNLNTSKLKARHYAESASYVYSAESLFEYLEQISKNPLWTYKDINFLGEQKKAIKTYNFLSQIPKITKPMAILCELLCHWRNRIVHLSISNADISSNKKQILKSEKDDIYEKFHHFDIEQALTNFKEKKITLKDTSTLITITIKCIRLVDEYFHKGISNIEFSNLKIDFLRNKEFKIIYNQTISDKRTRQIEKWIKVNYPYLTKEKYELIIKNL
ncbi:hypothetical protein [Polaribacter sp. 20A6]|uniref:hypothetical protein n=1 Tax=Polaribacter sp. 20A6 TaxID=2687289 RepID=UPI0013FDD6A2|nr:hypothetical protein [Polaribacter sp. 20A6]